MAIIMSLKRKSIEKAAYIMQMEIIFQEKERGNSHYPLSIALINY